MAATLSRPGISRARAAPMSSVQMDEVAEMMVTDETDESCSDTLKLRLSANLVRVGVGVRVRVRVRVEAQVEHEPQRADAQRHSHTLGRAERHLVRVGLRVGSGSGSGSGPGPGSGSGLRLGAQARGSVPDVTARGESPSSSVWTETASAAASSGLYCATWRRALPCRRPPQPKRSATNAARSLSRSG